MKITGSGVICAGEYNEEISVCGSGKIDGNISCNSFKCSGALKSLGEIVCSGDVKVSGSMRTEHGIKGTSMKVSGSCTANGDVVVKDEISVSGSLKSGGRIKASKIKVGGTLHSKNGIEAEEIKIEGKIKCEGLLNAERLEIKLGHFENSISGIGGSEILISPGKTVSFVKKVPLISKIAGADVGKLSIDEGIEGDTVKISFTKCKNVIGRVVEIGPECEIESVKYTDSVCIDPGAKIGKCEKTD